MTLQELSKYYDIQMTLEKDREALERLRQRITPASPQLTGMPHTPGVRDKVGDLAVELADMDERIRWLEELAAQEKPKVEAYCKSIVDARMYLVFRLRFIRCYSWAEVAGVLGKGYTEDGVSRMAYNYLNKNGPISPAFAGLFIFAPKLKFKSEIHTKSAQN